MRLEMMSIVPVRGFPTYHPVVVFAFFLGAIVLSVLVTQPAVQGLGLACAALLFALLARRRSWKTFAALAVAFAAVALINPLFNSHGATVLFMLPWGRPYTLQALLLGASTACMFVTVLLWFFSFNKVMTSDSLTYLFGWLAPAATLVITMALRLLPTYRRKAQDIVEARACIGDAPSQGSASGRLRSALAVFSTLATDALEGSIVTADSMRCRGYGSGKRTTYKRHAFVLRDGIALAVLCAAWAVATASLAVGGGAFDLSFATGASSPLPVGIAGFLAYGVFCATPICIHIWETISWSISLSKI